MDVRLSPEQQALRDSAAQVADRLGPQRVAELDDAERAAKLDAAVAASGWRELRTATEAGEPWASGVEAAIVVEELARGLVDTPLVGPTLASELRRLAGAPAATASETVVLAVSLGALTDDGRGVAIDASGASAGLWIDERRQLVSRELTGPTSAIDLTRPSIVVESAAAGTPIVGARSMTEDDVDRWTALGLALTSADLVGTMRGAVELAREYAIDRHQYGVAIGSFQAVQHLLADAFVAMEGSRSVALHAAWAVDALPPADAIAAGAVAKAYCARAARAVCETAIQVHGGIGNTWDCLAHVHLRRALLSTDVLGGVGSSLERVLAHQGIGAGSGLR